MQEEGTETLDAEMVIAQDKWSYIDNFKQWQIWWWRNDLIGQIGASVGKYRRKNVCTTLLRSLYDMPRQRLHLENSVGSDEVLL